VPGVSVLSFAEKKVPKKAAETYYCVSFRGAAIGRLCYCGAGLRGFDWFVLIAHVWSVTNAKPWDPRYKRGPESGECGIYSAVTRADF